MAREGNVFTFKEGSLLIRTGRPRIDVSSPQKKPGHSNYPRYFLLHLLSPKIQYF